MGSPLAIADSWTLGLQQVAITPNGLYLYVTYAAGGLGAGILGFTINATTGALTAVAGSPFGAGTDASSIAIDPRSKCVYVGDVLPSGGGLSAYTVTAGGVLTPASVTRTNPAYPVFGLVADRTGLFVYVTDLAPSGPAVEIFTVNQTTGVIAQTSSLGAVTFSHQVYGIAVTK